MKSNDIAGYTYRAENYTPDNLIRVMVARGDLSPAALDMSAEDALDQHASALAIDRDNERTFDSGEFPKVIFWDQVDMEYDREWLGESAGDEL